MALGNNGMEYLEELPEKLVEYWAMLELDILRDMARKLRAAELYIPATEYQHRKLSLLGMMYNDILELLAGALGSTFDAIEEIITNEGINTLREEAGKYRTAAELGLLEAVPERKLGSVAGAVGAEELTEAQVRANIANLLENDDVEAQAIKQIIDAGIAKTEGTFSNLTSTTANTATQQFERALDRAYMQVSTGAFSLEKAVEDAVEELAAQGIGSITYPSGRVDTVEVAVRRAVVTGTNQTNLKLREQFADEMECDLVEVSAHEGARPEHAEWQGKIYSRKGNDPKYPDFAASTGYGTGPGLGGWNCRHTFSAYFEGMPRAWSDEELEQLKNETVEYKGEQIPRYVAQQRMREMERNVRRYRREAAVADDERAAGFLEKEREARARYVDFCKETGLKEQPERFRSANVFNNTNKSAESRDVLLKKIRNQESDYEQYEKYKAVLGENAPKSFADFQNLKYNSGDRWDYTKQFVGYKRRVPEATEADFQKYRQVKATGVIGTIWVPPEKIDASKLVFRDEHAARHGCTVEEARGYVESAVCSIRRKKWDGESVNFYSLDGATYIDPETLQIKTSFPRKEFDPTTKAIAEVFE